MNEVLDIKCLPTGYNTSHLSTPNTYDKCNHPLISYDEWYDGEVLICGHRYHLDCFAQLNYRCKWCETYYKKGISDNIKSFIWWLEKGTNVLTNDDQDDENTEEDIDTNDDVENVNIRDGKQVSIALNNSLNNINNW